MNRGFSSEGKTDWDLVASNLPIEIVLIGNVQELPSVEAVNLLSLNVSEEDGEDG